MSTKKHVSNSTFVPFCDNSLLFYFTVHSFHETIASLRSFCVQKHSGGVAKEAETEHAPTFVIPGGGDD